MIKLEHSATKRGYLLLAAAICLLLIVIYIFLLRAPLRGASASAEARAQVAAAQVVKVTNFHNAHISDEKKYEQDLQQRQERADKALPDTIEQGRIVGYLQSKALASRLELCELAPGEPRVQDGLRVLPLKLKLRGDYFSLLDFLEQLQDGERYTIIQRPSVRSKDGYLECVLEIDAFAMAENTTNEK